ncbi:MAG: thioesterase family protein [Bacteroidia bacterium]
MEIETYRGVVYPWHCDFNDHMNVRYYMAMYDEATWQYLFYIGITPFYLKQECKAIVAAEQNMKYFEELHAGDLIYIRTGLIELKPKAIIMHHKMIKVETNNLVAEAKMVGIHIDKKTRLSVVFPEKVIAMLS